MKKYTLRERVIFTAIVITAFALPLGVLILVFAASVASK